MANTFELIESFTVGSGGAASVTFGSGGTIPQTYTDLCLKVSVRSNRSASEDGLGVTLNSSTSGYTYRLISGNGSTASSVNTPYEQIWAVRVGGNTTTSNTFSSVDIYFPNYAISGQKSYAAESVSENNGTEAYATVSALLQSSTAAITSLTVGTINGTMAQHTTLYLYGVKNA